jgi:hypothetical protein
MDKVYWFKRRRYGYGWTPVTWQGWTAVGIYLLLAISGALLSQVSPFRTLWYVATYLVLMLLGLAVILYLSWKYGPTPKWRWGKKASDNPQHDF